MNYFITALVLISYELNLFFRLKVLFGIPKHQYKKPFDCFFCLSVWANTLVLLWYQINTFINQGFKIDYNSLVGWAMCIILSKIIDVLINKN